MSTSHLSIVLHAHLPFVRHPENPYHLEENWFFEAMHETYLPLLQMLRRVDEAGLPGKLTVSVSAPLLSMMTDDLLIDRFEAHLDMLIELAEKELERTSGHAAYTKLANYYSARFQNLKHFFTEDLNRSVMSEFARLDESGRIDLITCVGTHPIMPFMATEGGRRAQVRAACDLFEDTVGRRPKGIWLAECAFSPGTDKYLAEEGIAYTFVENNGIENADSEPVYGNFAPLISEHDVAFFGRDQLASAQVWSATQGYPGDFDYREFYRDLGFDLDLDYIAPYIHPDGIRVNTGLKYHRITGDVDLSEKAPYDPEKARNRAWDHAADFIKSRVQQGHELADFMGDRPVHMTCPYDSELFGHWWFEGPIFLEGLFHRAAEQDDLILSSPLDYLAQVKVHQKTTPATSTWGEGSYFSVWLDPSNAWIYRHLRQAETAMVSLVADYPEATGLQERALRQAGRELLLAQSSDWPFIMKTATAVEYATARVEAHIDNFKNLVDQVREDSIDVTLVASLETSNNIFPNLDWRVWAE